MEHPRSDTASGGGPSGDHRGGNTVIEAQADAAQLRAAVPEPRRLPPDHGQGGAAGSLAIARILANTLATVAVAT
jgi:hypothetical protein